MKWSRARRGVSQIGELGDAEVGQVLGERQRLLPEVRPLGEEHLQQAVAPQPHQSGSASHS